MKTFKQFSEQAYESYELVEGPIDYLKSKTNQKIQDIKNIPSNLRSTASAVRQDPIGSLKTGVKGSVKSSFGLGKWMAKDELLKPVTEPLKRVTGNNPVTNFAINTASDIAAAAPWRQTARTVVKQAPKLANTFARNLFVRGPQLGASAASAILGGSRLK